jgi:polyphosphate kinase
LKEAGCTLFYGIKGYKVHSKVCLITRKSGAKFQYLVQLGTGNYHEESVKSYADLCLMTAHPGLGADVAAFFRSLAIGNWKGRYRYLLAAPYSLRPMLLELIDGEIIKRENGFLFFKMNALTDRTIMDKLIQASQAGVQIVLNVRGICCLRPGIPGLTDHIQVFSIVGRFLEHARIFAFGTGDSAKIYLSSADLMTRNTQRRVELVWPILDPALHQQVSSYIDALCHDTAKARLLRPDGTWAHVPRPPGTPSVDAQAQLLSQIAREKPTEP